MAAITFEAVGKIYDGGTRALADFELQVADGEFVVLVGPSGCGKTTALRMVAGLEAVTEGEIRIGDRVVNGLEPRKRDVAMVFQNYALYPHMSVYDNIAFGLKIRRRPKVEIRRRVEETARVLGLDEVLGRKPAQLSGGQRQRVAMGRAIVREPQAFLMDEPLSNLDAKLRVQMRAEIARIQREVRATTLYVTHDQVEAMTMGDRVAVLRKGELQQVGPPQELYDRPRNLFVASFIGSPAVNLVQARLEAVDGLLHCLVGEQRLTLANPPAALARYAGRTVGLGMRPEHLQDAALVPDTPPDRRLRGRVLVTELLGAEFLAHVEVDAEPVATSEVREVARDVDEAVLAELRTEAAAGRTPLVARFERRSPARAGDAVELAVDTSNVHLFDLESGLAIR